MSRLTPHIIQMIVVLQLVHIYFWRIEWIC